MKPRPLNVDVRQLSERLGVDRDRVSFDVKYEQQANPAGGPGGVQVRFEILLDGHDLNEQQLAIARRWIDDTIPAELRDRKPEG